MVFPFKIRVFKQHENESDDGWLRFDFVFDLSKVQITAFEEHVLFDKENNPTKCTQIFLSDGDWVYCCSSLDKFLEVYNKEYKEALTAYAVHDKLWNGEVEEEPGFWKRLFRRRN